MRALRSMSPEERHHFPVLLWDNGSSDGTVEAVAKEFPEVFTHHHPENLGVASGRNAGAKLAIERFDPTHLLFLDNDMVLEPRFAEALLAPFRDDDRGGDRVRARVVRGAARPWRVGESLTRARLGRAIMPTAASPVALFA